MKPVDQTIVDVDKGDCVTSCLVSILELPRESVPNFIELGQNWFSEFWKFLKVNNCEFLGTGWPKSIDRPNGHLLNESPNIDGFVIASVPSRTFDLIGHSVVIDLSGKVVHDPNPNKKWQNENVIETNQLQNWMMINRNLEIKT